MKRAYDKGKKFIVLKIIPVCICLLFYVSLASAQQQITLKVKNKPMYEVLEQVRSQAKVDLLGDLTLLKNTKPVTLNVNNRALSDVLKIISEGQPVEFTLVKNTIITKARLTNQYTDNSLPKSNEAAKAATVYKLKGVVQDESGNGLAGVSIQFIGSKSAVVHTSANGSYEISVDADGILQASMLGYGQQRIAVKGKSSIDILLRSQMDLIDEVLVNTGYTQRAKPSLTGASSVITRKDLEKFNHRNIFSILQSLDPVLFVDYDVFSGSNPNTIPQIYIRGINNIGFYAINAPLVILDGFEVTLERLCDLDINSIQSISLLKDVSTTVLYGSRGGNGVLVVETRLPQAGKPRITYNVNATITVPDLSDYNVMNAEQKLDYEKSAGLYDASTFYERPSDIAAYQEVLHNRYTKIKKNILMGVDTYWLSQPLEATMSLANSLRIEGGSERLQFGLEGNYGDLKGAMKHSGRERKDAALQLIYRGNDRISLTNHTIFQQIRSYQSPYGSFGTYTKMNPYQRIHDDTGALIMKYADETVPEITYNPLYNVDLPFIDQANRQLWSNRFSLRWDINDAFVFKTNAVVERRRYNEERYLSARHTHFAEMLPDSVGEYYTNDGKGLAYSANINLGYTKEINDHIWNANVIGEIKSNRFDQEMVLRKGFTDSSSINPAWIDAAATSRELATSNKINRLAGVLFTGNYLYKRKYVADLSYRIDGASNFGRNNRYSHFWSMGVGYNLHEEALLKDLDIQQWRVFVNTGVNGTEAFIANMNSSSYKLHQGQGYFKDDAYQYFYEGNADLRWPQIRSWSIGTVGRLWDERLKFSFNYYYKVTDRMISWIKVAPSLGLANSSYFENMGQLQNRGFEAEAAFVLLKNTDNNLSWDVGASTVSNRGKLIKISDALSKLNESNLTRTSDGSYFQNTYYQQGESVNNIKGVPSLGIDPASGKEMFLTKTGNITDKWDPADIRVIGNREPKLFGNLSSVFTYKSFNLQAYFTYTLGGDIYNYMLVDRIENNNGQMNTDLLADQQRWREPGDVVAFKDRRIREKTFLSSRFVQRENTLRFSMLMLNYDLPSEWISKYRMQRLKVNFAMNDVMRWSSIKMERGLDYPFAAAFNFGLMAQF